MKKTIFLIIVLLVLSFNAVAEAVPIEYTMTGHIRETVNGTSRFLDMTGSFLLSDPVIIYNYYNDTDPRFIVDIVNYDLADIVFRTDEFVLHASGRMRMNSYYGATDSYYWLYMDGYHVREGDLMLVDFPGQSIYEQPERIRFYLGGYQFESDIPEGPLYSVFMTEAIRTASVPEPATLLLFGSSLVGWFAWRKMFKRMIGDLSN